MSKELLIMRHAKSSWDDHSQRDHDRPLNQRGLCDAPRMAGLLSELHLEPDLILTSSARRARATADLMLENLNRQHLQLEIVAEFYHAQPDIYVDHCRRLADQFQRPMVIGHNPGLEDWIGQIAGQWPSMSTAAIAHVTLDINHWSEFKSTKSANATLNHIYRPKEI